MMPTRPAGASRVPAPAARDRPLNVALIALAVLTALVLAGLSLLR
jgi:hypothetical protein